MSASQLRNSIKELYTAYGLQQRDLSEQMKRDEARVLQYAPAFQEGQREKLNAETQKTRTTILQAFKPQIADLKGKIEGERKEISLNIRRVRFPGLTSKDPTERAIAENQINSALLFLSTPHSAEAIASAIREAIDLNRNDFAFMLIDGVRAGIPKDISGQDKPSEAQQALLSEIKDIENSFEGRAKLDELQTELKHLPALQILAEEFQRQVEAGCQTVILPELYPVLSEKERAVMIRDVEERRNITEQVHFKRRVAAAMSQHS